MTKSSCRRLRSPRLRPGRGQAVIVGMLTLVTFPLPSGLRARIEDVVVDQDARGQGVGTALTMAAIDQAQAQGGSEHRPDLPGLPGRGQPALPATRLPASRLQRLPVPAPASTPLNPRSAGPCWVRAASGTAGSSAGTSGQCRRTSIAGHRPFTASTSDGRIAWCRVRTPPPQPPSSRRYSDGV